MSEREPHIVLFNDERYQRGNLRSGQRLFRYDHCIDGRYVGTLAGVVEDGLLDCGHSAPFGGIDLVRAQQPVSVILELLRAAVCSARADGIRAIRIRARPSYYGPNETASQFALINLGATIEACELSLGIETRRFRSPQDYMSALGDSARNMVRQGFRSGMRLDSAQSPAEWAACFELLGETKRRRGGSMKFSFDYLMRLRDVFGPRIAMHRLVNDSELAGAALVYRVAPQWDCVAAWGDVLRHRKNRVMNLMVYHLVRLAVAERVAVLDLGTSSLHGVPDEGLIRFKRSVGGATGVRLDFRLEL